MRCRNHGCNKKLRVRATRIVCSDACERELRAYCDDILEILDGKVAAHHLSPYHRYKNNHPVGRRVRKVA